MVLDTPDSGKPNEETPSDHNWASASFRLLVVEYASPCSLNGWHARDLLGPNETIPEGTVGSDVVEMSEPSNKALNRK
jgi:hypothetical protein